jgi:hypothetical protein
VKRKETPENSELKTGSVLDLENVPTSKKKPPSKDERLQKTLRTVLAKLDIDPIALAQAPPLTVTLEQAEGGIPAVIAALRFSTDHNVQAFLKSYDECTAADRQILPLEAFALMAEVNIPQLLGAAIFALQNQFANIVKVIAVTNHPRVMRARIRQAVKPGGYRDRNAIDTGLRFLPVSKGATVLVPVPYVPGMGSPTQPELQDVNPEDVDTDDLFPDLAETQKMLTE